jgi:hypothetical protein
LICPKDGYSGYVTTLGLQDPSKRGIYKYNITNSSRVTDTELVIPVSGPNEQFLSILLFKKDSQLFYHRLNGDVVKHDLKNGVEEIVLRTSILSNELDIAPGCSLKADKNETDLFVMSGQSQITVLKGIGLVGNQSKLIEVNGISGHPFGDFIPFGIDKLAVLCLSSMLLIFEYGPTGSKMLHHSLLKSSLSLPYEPVTNTFDVCSKEQFVAVSFHDPSTNSKDKLVLIDVKNVERKPPQIVDVYACPKAPQEIGSAFVSVNLQFYHNGAPIIICTDMDTIRKTQVFTTNSQKIEKHLEFSSNKLGFTSRKNANSLWTVDQYGTITQMIIPQSLSDISNRTSSVLPNYLRNPQESNPFEIPAEKPTGAHYGAQPVTKFYQPGHSVQRLGPSMANLNPSPYSANPGVPTYTDPYINKENQSYRLTPSKTTSTYSYPTLGGSGPHVVRRLDHNFGPSGATFPSSMTYGRHPSTSSPYRPLVSTMTMNQPLTTQTMSPNLVPPNRYNLTGNLKSPEQKRKEALGHSPELIRSSYGAYPTKTRVKGGVPGGLTKTPVTIEESRGTKHIFLKEPYQTRSLADMFRSKRTNLMKSRRSTNVIGLDHSATNYFSVNNMATTFDSKRFYDPTISPQYNTNQKSYLKKSSKRNKPIKVKSYYEGTKSDDAGKFPWDTDPLKDKNDDITLRDLGRTTGPHSHHASRFDSVAPEVVPLSNFQSNTSNTSQTALERLIYSIKHPEVYQTGFDSCINIIPILPEFGYVNCASTGNRLAQYEINKDGQVRQTEILKSKFFVKNFNSWAIL